MVWQAGIDRLGGQMDDPKAGSRDQDNGTAAWFGFWAQFIVLGGLAIGGPVFAIIGLIGLFIAAAAPGTLRDAGIGLFAASGAIVFLSLKRVFDNLDARR